MNHDEIMDFDALDPARFRQVLSHYPTGVCAVTARLDDGELAGMAIGSFTSVSLDPPLVAFFATTTSASWQKIRSAGRFCVNVLSSGQEWLCRRFSSRDEDKFHDVPHAISCLGNPILEDVLATIECEIHSVIDAGDHSEVRGRVINLRANDGLPLLFYQGKYGYFQSV
ncbi:flavin reductase family protein [Novosphingobium sp. PY1]|uniref:Flavin reductase-like, FMN-binding n=1 Tax=Ochrobactrum sp. PW1 TaxID=1882222 RepID=A0A292GTE1_9HYPH|nr:flavin reductase family protein [Novosphingobium sp. PY1]BBA74542.1 flavin reductase-like, FMN-binding [Ochrobactrum sp. PW1]GFM29391.1 flavin reductase-like, FMN-binding [Novosphingobium sp. PY1]